MRYSRTEFDQILLSSSPDFETQPPDRVEHRDLER
jgi:hypothetical protein